MKEPSSSPLDRALECVPQDRRKFLGMLLAGVVAAPLVATTVLAAEATKKPQNAGKQQKSAPAVSFTHSKIDGREPPPPPPQPVKKSSSADYKNSSHPPAPLKNSSAPLKNSTQTHLGQKNATGGAGTPPK